MGDIFEVEGLYCTICHHDLNHPLYKICAHSILPVPLCVLCKDDLGSIKTNSELCGWCGDGGNLFLCSKVLDDGTECAHSFCEDCLTANLGEDTVREIERSDEWYCLVCDPSQLVVFDTAIKEGNSVSIFGDTYQQKVMSDLDADDSERAEEVVAINRLNAVVEECNAAAELLNNEVVTAAKCREIRDEITASSNDPNLDINQAVLEEFTAYELHWQRHMDILLRQEADLFEQVSCYGFDVRSLPVYADATTALGKDRDPDSPVEQQYLAADKRFFAMKKDRLAEVRRDWGSSHAVDTKLLVDSIQYVEDVQEEDLEEKLPARLTMAESDESLLKYSEMADPDPSLYPPSFLFVQPLLVLKALFYGSVTSAEIISIVSRYEVAKHIVMIMSVARMQFPRSTNYWSFAGRVHPSVRKALYHSSSVLEQVYLCAHYDLPEEMSSVTDFGDAEDICGIFHERKRREATERAIKRTALREARASHELNSDDDEDEEVVNDHADEVNPDVLNDLLEKEDEAAQVQQSALLREARQKDLKSGQKVEVKAAQRLARMVAARQQHDADDDFEILEQREVDVKHAGVSMSKRNGSNRGNRRREEKEKEKEEKKVRHPRSSSAVSQSGVFSQISSDETEAHRLVSAVSPQSGREMDDAPVVAEEDEGNDEEEEEEDVPMTVDDEIAVEATSQAVAEMAVDSELSDDIVVEEDEEEDVVSFVRRASVRAVSEPSERIGDIAGADTSDEEDSVVVGVRRTKTTEGRVGSSLEEERAKSRSSSVGIAAKGSSHHNTIDLTLSDGEEEVEVEEEKQASPKPTKVVDSGDSEDTASTSFSSSESDSGSNEERPPRRGKLIKRRKAAPVPRRSARNAPSEFSSSDDDDSDATALEEGDEANSTSFSSDDEGCEEVLDEETGARYFQPSPARKSGSMVVVQDDDIQDVTETRKQTSSSTMKSGGLANWFSSSVKTEVKGAASKPPLSGAAPSSKGVPSFFNSTKSNNYNIKDILESGDNSNSWLSSSRAVQVKLTDTQLTKKYFTAGEDGVDTLPLNADLVSQHKPVLMISELVPKLKEHQKEGLAFIWRNVLENSYQQLTREKGDRHNKKADNGCVLAHCMGLGKTFTVIAFVVTMLTNPVITSLIDSYQPPEEPPAPDTKKSSSSPSSNAATVTRPPKRLIQSVLIIAPLVTLENWTVEFKKWTPADLQPHSRVVFVDANMKSKERLEVMRKWHLEGGVLVIGYTMLRLLTTAGKSKSSSSAEGVTSVAEAAANMSSVFRKLPTKVAVSDEMAAACRYLLDPGPDLVIADEAHQLSNNKSKISIAFNRMRTKRRIALTGSPLQNNLVEYWCMVDWVKHHHLQSQNRFKELFVKPIAAGDKDDAGPYEVKEMRKKVYVLNKNLRNIVNRKDFAILTASLKMKRQFVLVIHMTTFQQFLYRTFLAKLMAIGGPKVKLFKTYQCFLRLWNHPCCTVAQTLYAKQLAETKRRQLLVAGKSSKGKMQPVAPAPLTMNTMIRELSVTYNYFQVHGKRLLAELQSSTKAVEDALLKPTAGIEELGVCDDGEGDENEGDGDEDLYGDEEAEEGDNKGVKRCLSASTLDPDDEEDGEGESEREGGGKRVRTETTGFVPIGATNSGIASMPQSSLSRGISDNLQSGGSRAPTPTMSGPPATLALDWWKHVPSEELKPSSEKKAAPLSDMMDLTGDDEEGMAKDDIATLSRLMSARDLMQLSNKMVTFLSLLALSVLAGDKVLVFSQSLYTLDVIEQFLKMTSWAQDLLPPSEDNVSNNKKFSNWYHGKDYLRIDGKTKDRQTLIDRFNDPKRGAFKLFMVCTKAGNMGINLYTANRVVIFDSSWNPVHDLQAISRAYRYGQQKEVFVYRLVAAGSMEEVIYKRQMLKQALAARVVDAQMPDNQSNGGGLMDFDHEDGKSSRQEDGVEEGGSSSSSGGLVLSETVHQDAVLMQYVEKHASRLSYIADQEVLLADKEESHLNAEEQVAAEAEYEKEVKREAYIAQLTQQAQVTQLQAINTHRATMGLPPLPVVAPLVAPVAAEESYEESQTFNDDQAMVAADETANQIGSSGSSIPAQGASGQF